VRAESAIDREPVSWLTPKLLPISPTWSELTYVSFTQKSHPALELVNPDGKNAESLPEMEATILATLGLGFLLLVKRSSLV
jgi:hypothetical protein